VKNNEFRRDLTHKFPETSGRESTAHTKTHREREIISITGLQVQTDG
jgi:hypothetical protein